MLIYKICLIYIFFKSLFLTVVLFNRYVVFLVMLEILTVVFCYWHLSTCSLSGQRTEHWKGNCSLQLNLPMSCVEWKDSLKIFKDWWEFNMLSSYRIRLIWKTELLPIHNSFSPDGCNECVLNKCFRSSWHYKLRKENSLKSWKPEIVVLGDRKGNVHWHSNSVNAGLSLCT